MTLSFHVCPSPQSVVTMIPQTGSSSVSLPHSLLSIMPLLCIYLLPSPPSLLCSSSSSHCALTSPLPFHTQAASSTSPLLPFTLTSLRSSHLLFLSVTYRHRPSSCCRPPPPPRAPSPLPFLFPFLLAHTLSPSRANSRSLTHTHADWHPRTERTLSLERRRPGGLLVQPPGFLTPSSAEEEDEEVAMEHSHIFSALPPNESSWSAGQHPSEATQGCPLGPLPVIYYGALLCLGLPGE